MTGNDRESRSQQRRKSSGAGANERQQQQQQGAGVGDNPKMAAQSQGIKQLMAAEKEAAQVVANARKSEFFYRGVYGDMTWSVSDAFAPVTVHACCRVHA